MAKTRTTLTKAVKKTSAKLPKERGAQPEANQSTPSPRALRGIATNRPVYAEPVYIQDPLKFKTPHASDAAAYKELDALIASGEFQPLPFPVVAGVAEPVLRLALRPFCDSGQS